MSRTENRQNNWSGSTNNKSDADTYSTAQYDKSIVSRRVNRRLVWSWREELNLQPVVYKLGPAESEITQEQLTQGKTEEPEEPSS